MEVAFHSSIWEGLRENLPLWNSEDFSWDSVKLLSSPHAEWFLFSALTYELCDLRQITSPL